MAAGDVVGGKYRVERVLGSGGMGVVVAATHVDLEQPVALKFILPHALAGKGNVERFLREARAAVRLKSEHVARVYDVGRDLRDGEERPYMVLELLEGMDLAKLVKQKGSLPVADAVEYVLQACEALVEAHAAGIVHRDLKPQNLFVTRRLNGTPLVKVLDFGISKAIGPGAEGQMSLTDSAAIIGSPLYMAPEQMRSARAADVRSDVWGLGVILYELLGGQLPFDGETVTEVCIRVVNEAPPALLELRPALDPRLVAIVMRCLEKEPAARFHNVAALAAALEPYSRSAKQGGPVRPWRSFEDTQDSQDGNVRAAIGASDAAPHSGPADATGPATPITLGTLPPDAITALAAAESDEARSNATPSEDERRARANAGSTKASPGARSARDGSALASTDTSWGEATSKESAQAKPTRSFTTGLVAGVVVSLGAAAAVAALLIGRGGASAGGAAAAGTSAGSVTEAPALTADPAGAAAQNAQSTNAKAGEGSPAAKAGAGAKADEEASAKAKGDEQAAASVAAAKPAASSKAHGAHPVPPIGTASGAAARILGAKATRANAARANEGAAGTSSTSAAPAPRAPGTESDPVAPNGAPILR